jgi:hypothetical protein
MNSKNRQGSKVLIIVLIGLNIVGLTFFIRNQLVLQQYRVLLESNYTSEDYELKTSLKPRENITIFLSAYSSSPNLLNLSILTNKPEYDVAYAIKLIPDQNVADEYDDSFFNNSLILFHNPSIITLEIDLIIQLDKEGNYWIVIVKNLVDNWELYYNFGWILFLIILLYLGLLGLNLKRKKPSQNEVKEFFLINHEDIYKNVRNFLPIVFLLSWIITSTILYFDVINFHGDPSLYYDMLFGLGFAFSGLTLFIFIPLMVYVSTKVYEKNRKRTLSGLVIIIIGIIALIITGFILLNYYGYNYITPLDTYNSYISIIIIICLISIIVPCLVFPKKNFRKERLNSEEAEKI